MVSAETVEKLLNNSIFKFDLREGRGRESLKFCFKLGSYTDMFQIAESNIALISSIASWPIGRGAAPLSA